MTTAQFSITEHLQDPDVAPNGYCSEYFSHGTPGSRMHQLYQVVWTNGHLPIKRAKIVRPENHERLQDVCTPEECWVVQTKAFSALNAPETVMIRQEYVQCFADLIREYSQPHTTFMTSAGSGDYLEGRAVETLEELSFDALGGIDSSLDASSPSSASFPNPFDCDLLRKAKYENCTGVIVSGQSGIGKSVQLLLILILRLHAHLPTIWQTSDDKATLFTHDGVFTIALPSDLSDMSDVGEYIPPCSWILFDTNPKTKSWPRLTFGTNLFVVQASSPRKDRFSWTSKAVVSMWYMKPFTLPELLVANHWQTVPQKESKLKEFMEKYAPSARIAYVQAGRLPDFERAFRTSIRETSDNALRQLMRDASALNMDLHIVRFDPTEFRSEVKVSLASRFIWDTIEELSVKGDAERLSEWYSLFLSYSFSRRTTGWVLDSAFHCSLFRKRQWLVLELEQTHCYWVSSPSAIGQFMTFDPEHNAVNLHPKASVASPSVVPMESYDINTFLRLSSEMCYYQPIQRTQATFDSFLWTGKQHGLAVVFQVTVHENHRVKESGLDWLLDLDGVMEVWYVAVTPRDVSVNFTLDVGVQEESKIMHRLHIEVGPEDLR